MKAGAGPSWHVYFVSWSLVLIHPGPPVVPFYPFLGEGSPTQIDKTGEIKVALILTSLLEDLDIGRWFCFTLCAASTRLTFPFGV